MKFKIHILLFYLIALTALPSVRAMKMNFGNSCKMSCQKNDDSECEKGKFVMSLNFSPVQFVKELNYDFIFVFQTVDKKDTKSFYENFFNSNYQNAIWHPPKNLL